jgi:hypothetical protein
MYIGRAIVTCNNASPRIIGTVKLIFMNIETPICFCNKLWSYDMFEWMLKKKTKKKLVDRFTDTITYRRFNVHKYEFDCTNNSRWSIIACDYVSITKNACNLSYIIVERNLQYYMFRVKLFFPNNQSYILIILLIDWLSSLLSRETKTIGLCWFVATGNIPIYWSLVPC